MIFFYVIKQYERAVVFKLGKVVGPARGPGLIFIVPFVQRINRVSLRIVTMPIQSQGIITKDNVSIDVSAVAYYRVEDPIRAVIAIENVEAAISQIAQTTLRAVVGRHTLDETLSETDTINQNIREILDPVVSHCGHVNAHVVLGNDSLGLDRHRDDPQRDAINALNKRHDENQTRSARRTHDLPELEYHRALVLLDDIEKDHGRAFLADVMGSRRRSLRGRLRIAVSSSDRTP